MSEKSKKKFRVRSGPDTPENHMANLDENIVTLSTAVRTILFPGGAPHGPVTCADLFAASAPSLQPGIIACAGSS